ncbi:hypothetical protein BDY21DRAFT_365605 [Lineolata rhizophorae]|uniref:DUF7932 domain-containing protein n=1 Tax=Lineolata rhizophorae TaxID=578093 RepID=A0A6A6NV93_9PEZI|nr:hypothetical protein BDY21DRAFT_365605 [Lineolata rhizophorae]
MAAMVEGGKMASKVAKEFMVVTRRSTAMPNAGSGSNGANGGASANVFISVSEMDLDTLIGLSWDISGGKGGLSGTHGEPGDGGIGGKGGNGCSCGETREPQALQVLRAIGLDSTSAGVQPAPMDPVKSELLQVISYDVVDENEDKINEPGEHLLIRNIRVQNFEPIASEPLILPPNIPVGATVDVPGTLRTYIRNETVARAWNEPLCAKDHVSLIASFGRLNRAIPEFNMIRREIGIMYPLVLTSPKVLASVAKGDVVRFHWALKNNSTKAYGVAGGLRRGAATCLSDPQGVFNLSHATDGGREAIDELDFLEPGAEVPIDQDFTVSQYAGDYSYGDLRLDLQLSDPNPAVATKRVIMSYDIRMQVSGKYSHDPLSQFLLVVNSHTPLHAIHQTRRFIWNNLGLRVDTFNVSLVGSYTLPETQESVLRRYIGKSIIVFGNHFKFFDAGSRDPWSFLDPWEVSLLAKASTSFLFASTVNMQGLKGWGDMIAFPMYVGGHVEGHRAKTVKELVGSIHKEDQDVRVAASVAHTLSGQSASGTVKQMNKKLPLRRFATLKEGASSLAVIEGLPKTAQVFASVLGFSEGLQIPDYHAFMIVRSLPFYAQSRMFWNLAGKMGQVVPHHVLYGGLPGFQPLPNMNPTQFVIERKYCEAIGWAIESRIGTEVARFCSRSGWPHGIPGPILLDQLPLLSQFFKAAPQSAVITAAEGNEFLVQTLGTIYASALNIGFGRFVTQRVIRLGSRKAQLRPKILQAIRKALEACAPGHTATMLGAVEAAAKRTKDEIKGTKGKKTLGPLCAKRLALATRTAGADFVDLNTEINKISIKVKGPTASEMRTKHHGAIMGRSNDEGHAKAVLKERVVTDQVELDDIEAAPSPSTSPLVSVLEANAEAAQVPTLNTPELAAAAAAISTNVKATPVVAVAELAAHT